MIEKLMSIGMNEKEAKVYLYLIEYGISGASEIAKYLGYPKSTANFLADTLWKWGYVSKSIKSNTHYYEADIWLLESLLLRERTEKDDFLLSAIPLLRSMNQNIRTKPKIMFFDGEENCKKAYLEILEEEEIFYEFWAHSDLVDAFGEKFMDDFIAERVRRNLFCDSIGTDWIIEQNLHKKDTDEKRSLAIFDTSFGKIGSSISLYKDKVLILNLAGIYSGIRIQNKEFAETMKTIFNICKK